MLNEGNQIHNLISSSGSGTVIIYGSGSGSTRKSYGSYGSGSTTLDSTLLRLPQLSSGSFVSKDVGFEPRTVITGTELAVINEAANK